MKKKIFGGIAVLAIAAVAVFNVNLNTNSNNLSAALLANIEALAQNENPGNSCPDPYDVPNHYIVATTSSTTVTSNSKGEINVAGYVQGGYEKNKQVTVTVAIYNCSGEALNACCPQSEVRVVII
ncbi:hypothetical protein AGMMS50239_23340 [Bacteroidia bacterium]|nr:hypothetical protein AGMMS50239_23340 [Bacteroidia bacterium]